MHDAHWLVIANASDHFGPVWRSYARSRLVCVCDGAMALAQRHCLAVDLLIGDFDSIAAVDLSFARATVDTRVVPALDQNFTDLEKSIHFIDKQQPKSIVVVNALANRVDHSLYNLRLLARYHAPQRPLVLLTPTEKILFIRDQTVQLTGQVGDLVSVAAFNQAQVTSRGLRFDMSAHTLTLASPDSVSNCLSQRQARLEVDGSCLLMVGLNVEINDETTRL
jgi:thiamine pyrophosphokinase